MGLFNPLLQQLGQQQGQGPDAQYQQAPWARALGIGSGGLLGSRIQPWMQNNVQQPLQNMVGDMRARLPWYRSPMQQLPQSVNYGQGPAQGGPQLPPSNVERMGGFGGSDLGNMGFGGRYSFGGPTQPMPQPQSIMPKASVPRSNPMPRQAPPTAVDPYAGQAPPKGGPRPTPSPGQWPPQRPPTTGNAPSTRKAPAPRPTPPNGDFPQKPTGGAGAPTTRGFGGIFGMGGY